ncbi:nuclear transport factor 2 family protein [Christiangramia echinicola]|uniref:SnoaL-like domain-containing protein n=1 Tax=Christiangramia echinicola TaxID=279359 RepID=A0A1H1RKD1_9FLAO|nr:nuclear transport factor 2 family protein [Christiangramia echinicola]SDS35419.1 SnoaL-like domain-containing protein [Christiangramia echinicola]
MELSKKEIVELFSNGKFDKTMDYLSEQIVWNIVGENTFEGKKAVMENCEQTAEYFNSVQTDFKTEELIETDNKVIIIGTAEIKRDGKRLNFISACDIYEFNEKNEIEIISSYCIPEKKE